MKLSSNIIILLVGIIILIFAAIYLMMGKQTPVYAPQSQAPSTQYNVNSDLQELDSTDPNSLNSDLEQLNTESSPL